MNKPINITEEIKFSKILTGDLINKFIITINKNFKVSHIFYVSSKTNILTLKCPLWGQLEYYDYNFVSLEYYVSLGFTVFIL